MFIKMADSLQAGRKLAGEEGWGVVVLYATSVHMDHTLPVWNVALAQKDMSESVYRREEDKIKMHQALNINPSCSVRGSGDSGLILSGGSAISLGREENNRPQARRRFSVVRCQSADIVIRKAWTDTVNLAEMWRVMEIMAFLREKEQREWQRRKE
ncbi:unnamed protein product [Pleuronectes platessa]|uniref:Uncharacterized protein n=1 Tax=Pleuronectes platessa TaxID=8262 RepID=A0A9N7V8H2_PLEPL|nr:unnamed protein product [Pleuronectes platessa]